MLKLITHVEGVEMKQNILNVSIKWKGSRRIISLKLTVFWIVVPYSLVEIYQHFRGADFLHHKADEFTCYLSTLLTDLVDTCCFILWMLLN